MKTIDNKKKLLKLFNEITEKEECWNCNELVKFRIGKDGKRQVCPKCHYYQGY